MLGLKILGYKPSFTQAGLGFASGGQGPHATFEGYLNGLAEVDFSHGDGARVNVALGQFLFGDPNALVAGLSLYEFYTHAAASCGRTN